MHAQPDLLKYCIYLKQVKAKPRSSTKKKTTDLSNGGVDITLHRYREFEVGAPDAQE